jgi:hypothetical protein
MCPNEKVCATFAMSDNKITTIMSLLFECESDYEFSVAVRNMLCHFLSNFYLDALYLKPDSVNLENYTQFYIFFDNRLYYSKFKQYTRPLHS